MQPKICLALAVASLRNVAFAQPPIVPPLRFPISILPPLIQVESIDAAAKTVTLREFKFGPDQKPLPTEPITLAVAANASVVGFGMILPSSKLEIGDTVTLLGQKVPARQAPQLHTRDAEGFERPLSPLLLRILGEMRSGSGASDFEVVALRPQLTLRRGGEPKDKSRDAGFLRTPFSNGGDGKAVGFLSLTEAETGNGTVATLLITNSEKLEFRRFLPLDLGEMSALHAAKKIYIHAELSEIKDGKREVVQLVASKID